MSPLNRFRRFMLTAMYGKDNFEQHEVDIGRAKPEQLQRIVHAAIVVKLLAEGGHILPVNDDDEDSSEAMDELDAAVDAITFPIHHTKT